jgi:hypothetical protein
MHSREDEFNVLVNASILLTLKFSDYNSASATYIKSYNFNW